MQTVTIADIEYYVENELGGRIADDYTIVEKSGGYAVRCGSFVSDVIGHANFQDALHSLKSDVEYNDMYEKM